MSKYSDWQYSRIEAMKKLMYLVVIIALPLIVFFQYDHYVRHHPPADSGYPISGAIDADYHDPGIVLKYYETVEATSTFARYLWRKHKIDVRKTSPADGATADKVGLYHQYLATARHLEQQLIRSANWKQQGLSNDDIQYMEVHQVDAETMTIRKMLGEKDRLQFGDQSQAVLEVQKRLEKKGFSLRIDGIFDQETLQTVQAFQEANKLFPSGVLDDLSLRTLLQP